MKKNKFMSFALALIMALSLAVPAFASDPVTDYTKSQVVTINSAMNDAIITVTLSTTPGAVLNPYTLGYKARSSSSVFNYGQIASADNLIISTSNVPLDIGVVVEGNPANDIQLLDKAPNATSKAREVYMYAVFKALDTTLINGEAAVTAALAAPDTIFGTDADKAIDYGTVVTKGDGLNAVIVPAPEEETSEDAEEPEPTVVARLAGNNVEKESDGTKHVKSLSAVAYKMDGAMVTTPDAENGGVWNPAKDKVTVKMTYSFSPQQMDVGTQQVWARSLSSTATGEIDIGYQLAVNAADDEIAAADKKTFRVTVDGFKTLKEQERLSYDVILPSGVAGKNVALWSGTAQIAEKTDTAVTTKAGAATAALSALTATSTQAKAQTVDDDLGGTLVFDNALLRTALLDKELATVEVPLSYVTEGTTVESGVKVVFVFTNIDNDVDNELTASWAHGGTADISIALAAPSGATELTVTDFTAGANAGSLAASAFTWDGTNLKIDKTAAEAQLTTNSDATHVVDGIGHVTYVKDGVTKLLAFKITFTVTNN